MSDDIRDRNHLDVIIVGAGMAGLYMLHKLRGLGLSARILEQGDGVGGTWYWNRYPGARCDIESMDYSYSFDPVLEQEWHWSERYATQPEILRYMNHVADRYDLRRDISFNTRVTSAVYDEQAHQWTIGTDDGAEVLAKYCVMALGCLSVPQKPPFAGLDTFEGEWYQTGKWPHHAVDFRGKRVGVIGTGSSAIQSIPVIARDAADVTVFQRTANFSVPAHNAPLDPEYERWVKSRYREHRQEARDSHAGFVVPTNANTETPALDVSAEERAAEYWARWERGGFGLTSAFSDLGRNRAANETAAEFVRERIRETVEDPDVAELLSPRGYPLGTKRLCIDSFYYETYNQEHVHLVDVRNDPIIEVTPTGLRTGTAEFEFDILVFAIGFDAMTGALTRIDIRGRNGVRLAETWEDGPRTYLGVSVAGFPNLFTITGPGSPSVLTNMMTSIEQHVEWVSDCIEYLEEHHYAAIEATEDAQESWVVHVAELGEDTLYPLANSWYVGANIPGKPRVFMPYIGGFKKYVEECNEIVDAGYKGFILTE